MTLGFSQQINGKPAFFVEKIYVGLWANGLVSISKIAELAREPLNMVPESWQRIDTLRRTWGDFKPKLHSIRDDKHSKWKAGLNIHMVINNRTPKRYQFVPEIPCLSVQNIWIDYEGVKPQVIIDGKILNDAEVEILAVNDGFDDTDSFFEYFDAPNTIDGYYKAKIIHWTDLKY